MSGIAVAVVVLIVGAVLGALTPAIVFVAIMTSFLLVGLWFTRPGRSGVSIGHAAAQALGDDNVIVYWRPG